jgi:hypothetical protein
VGKSCHLAMMACRISSSGEMTNLPDRFFHIYPSTRSMSWMYPCSVISWFRSRVYLFWIITVLYASEPLESSFASQIVIG